MPKITTFLTFDHRAEEAVAFYTSIFEGSKVLHTSRYGEGGMGPKGALMSATFELAGQRFMALNGGPTFHFAEGTSLFVSCETQAEVDLYWEKLSEGGKPGHCGWLEDKFGVTWQVIPTMLSDVLGGPDPRRSARALQAMLGMGKLDIAALRRAYDEASDEG